MVIARSPSARWSRAETVKNQKANVLNVLCRNKSAIRDKTTILDRFRTRVGIIGMSKYLRTLVVVCDRIRIDAAQSLICFL